MIAASILEYITVTCCKEIAKKLFDHFFMDVLYGITICICIIASAVRITAWQIPGLGMTLHLDFQDFRSWKFYKYNFRYTLQGTDDSCLFCRISVRRVALYWRQKKTKNVWRNPGAISPKLIMRVHTVVLHLQSRGSIYKISYDKLTIILR